MDGHALIDILAGKSGIDGRVENLLPGVAIQSIKGIILDGRLQRVTGTKEGVLGVLSIYFAVSTSWRMLSSSAFISSLIKP